MAESKEPKVLIEEPAGESEGGAQARFGTFGGVFTPCVLTILGVIMFMRTGFVVGQSGLAVALIILGVSKLITTLTALSISAISTNIDMKGGGVYFLISRVLGPDFGGSIGITLFIAQAVSVAFYVIGFTEATLDVLAPVLASADWWDSSWTASYHLPQVISSVVTLILFRLTFKGADVALKAQFVVLAILALSILSFLLGGAMKFSPELARENLGTGYTGGMGFWMAFAIFFPAATGITAGVNMSGDLKNPARAIPWGTIIAILVTAAIYGAQILFLAGSTPRETLIQSPFAAVQSMSVFGPLIIMGVFAATLSSALGSFLGAPRILQAMGQDRLLGILVFFGKGAGATNEPRRATVLTFLMAVAVIWAGDLNQVAEVISMFFLIAYGMINLSAFVEIKSGNPSFRPTFRFFSWSTALLGAVACTVAMVKINDTYALIALAIVAAIYFYLNKRDIRTTYGDAKRGYIFKRTRDNLLYLEDSRAHPKNWRPILVTITAAPETDAGTIRLGSWLESRRGLYTVAHIARESGEIKALLKTRAAMLEEVRARLIGEGIVAFPEAVVAESWEHGLLTFMQSYSLGGLRPNTMLMAVPPRDREAEVERMVHGVEVAVGCGLSVLLHKAGDLAPRKKTRVIDLWWRGEWNGSLMALFAYLITRDPLWSSARIRFMRVVSGPSEIHDAHKEMSALRDQTRIPAVIEIIESGENVVQVIGNTSGSSDLVLLGFRIKPGEDAHKVMGKLYPLIDLLPSTVMVSSNGEADVFA